MKSRRLDEQQRPGPACHTQEEIAERENVDSDTVSKISLKMASLPELAKPDQAAVDMTRQAIAVWEDEFAKKLAADNFANSPDFDPPPSRQAV